MGLHVVRRAGRVIDDAAALIDRLSAAPEQPRHRSVALRCSTRYRSLISDSARWDGFDFRPGDIVISTPPKCGTTWTQMICALLVFQTTTFDQPLDLISPWLDMLTRERDDVVADLEAQTHRRFIKTHTPLDGLPYDDARHLHRRRPRPPRRRALVGQPQ